MKVTIEKHELRLKLPLSITGHRFTSWGAIRVTLERGEIIGRGEGTAVYYQNETTDSMAAQLHAVSDQLSEDLNREQVQSLLAPGGARNALDCALWDMELKEVGLTIWDKIGVTPRKLSSVATLGIDTAERMAKQALFFKNYANLKVKLSSLDPIGRLEAIRSARPDANLIVDVNQGWSFDELKEYAPRVKALGIAMIEQPLVVGGDECLEDFQSPILLGADECFLDLSDYEQTAKRYDVINVKLDKCGGLTEGLRIVERARSDGKSLMVGNMTGTSLSMAPSYVIGQYCNFVDIDGPLLLAEGVDVDNALKFSGDGEVSIPSSDLWG